MGSMPIFLVLLLLAAAQAPDLSGTWKLNVGASDWNRKEPPKSIVVTIEHREPVIKISGLVVEDRERTNEFRFDGAIDGKPYPSEEGMRTLRRIDARTLESTWKSNDGRYYETSTTKLSRDGRRLTRQIDLKRPDGRIKWTEIYEKQ